MHTNTEVINHKCENQMIKGKADDQGENKNNNKIKLRDSSCNDNDELVLQSKIMLLRSIPPTSNIFINS